MLRCETVFSFIHASCHYLPNLYFSDLIADTDIYESAPSANMESVILIGFLWSI